MGFLAENWDKIQTSMDEGTPVEAVAKEFLFPWNHDKSNMDMICKAIELLKPKKIIELGTFEGLGTIKIAKAMSEAGGGVLATFDAGCAPVNSLGPLYGVTPDKTLKDGYLVDIEKVGTDGWLSFKKVISKRQDRLSRKFEGVQIVYIEGLTFETLPRSTELIEDWDFCFQDTLHTWDEIWKELKILIELSHIGSIIVFDDIFPDSTEQANLRKLSDWDYYYTPKGHGQVWLERIE